MAAPNMIKENDDTEQQLATGCAVSVWRRSGAEWAQKKPRRSAQVAVSCRRRGGAVAPFVEREGGEGEALSGGGRAGAGKWTSPDHVQHSI